MILEIMQWVVLVGLLASRTILKSRLTQVENMLAQLQHVEDVVPEKACAFCVSEKWGPREELIGGQWVHFDESGRMQFCSCTIKPPS